MAPPKAAIFDLDGTLVDSAPDLLAAMNAVLRERGVAPLDLPTLRGFIGNGVPTLVSRSFAARGLPCAGAEHGAAVETFHAHYDADPAAYTTVYPGVRAVLDRLAGAGVTLGVCTNKYEAGARLVLTAMGLDGYFAATVGGDTLPVLKPDPAPLRLCAERLGMGVADIVFVGDSEVDAATAQAAGAVFALFTGGYRKTPAQDIPAAYRFDSFDALADWLEV